MDINPWGWERGEKMQEEEGDAGGRGVEEQGGGEMMVNMISSIAEATPRVT